MPFQLPDEESTATASPSAHGRPFMDGAKTLSLSSAGAYGPSEAASELQSGVGTSTALDLSATSDELVFEKILTLIKGALVPSQY